MEYISLFSGIEAASVAFEPLGWSPICFAEIEAFPSAVLKHHYPKVLNVGDMTRHDWASHRGKCDLVVGGPPCQAFSIAGLRKSMADDRGNLSLQYMKAIHAIDPLWSITENVPGWLSTGDNAFGCFLAGLVGEDAELVPPGGRWPDAGVASGPERTAAWRILDARHFGLAQRRRRVFVLSIRGTGNWRCAAALFPVGQGMYRDPEKGKRPRQSVAPTIAARTRGGGGLGTDFDCDGGLIHSDVAGVLNASMGRRNGQPDHNPADYLVGIRTTTNGDDVFPTLDAHHDRKWGSSQWVNNGFGILEPPVVMSSGQANAEITRDQSPSLTCLHEAPIVAQAFGGNTVVHVVNGNSTPETAEGLAFPLRADDGSGNRQAIIHTQAIAFDTTQITHSENRSNPQPGGLSPSLAKGAHPPAIAFSVKDHGGDAAEEISPTLRSGPLDTDGFTIGVLTRSQGNTDGKTAEAHAVALLRRVQRTIGEEAFLQWGLGILASLQPSQVLRSEVHGQGIRPAPFTRRWVVCCALGSPLSRAEGTLQSLREACGPGCPPQGWQPLEQCADELGAYLSELSQPGAQAQRLMRDLLAADEGPGVLREALSAFQEAWRSSAGEGQSTHGGTAVRRLTVEECEFLQGFPRGFTNVPYRGKDAADGPRYRALGNSMAIPVMAWIGQRIQMVEDLSKPVAKGKRSRA